MSFSRSRCDQGGNIVHPVAFKTSGDLPGMRTRFDDEGCRTKERELIREGIVGVQGSSILSRAQDVAHYFMVWRVVSCVKSRCGRYI